MSSILKIHSYEACRAYLSLAGFEYVLHSIDERDTSARTTTLLGNYARFCLPKRDLLFPSLPFFLLVDGVHRKLYKRDRHQKAFAASPLVVPTHSLLFNALSHLPSNTIYPEQESKPGIGLNEDGPLLLLELLHVPSTTCHSSVTVLNYKKYFLVTLHLYYTD